MQDLEKAQELYDNNIDFQVLADRIHESRMMPPPACDDCKIMALDKWKDTNER